MNAIEKSAPKEIDVIVPLYNNEKYAIDAIHSALAQTCPVRKIIVVDDGSTDRSVSIVEEHFAGNPQVEVVRVKHGGLPWARNCGLEKTDAAYIGFLDSDDIWYPEKLERQMAVFAANPATGLVYCSHNDIDEEGRGIPAPHRLIPSLRGYVHNDILRGNLISGGSAALVKRECLLRVGPFDEKLTYAEDWDMWLRLSKICPFDYSGEALLAIRRHSVQMSAGNSYTKRMQRLAQYLRIWSKWPDEVSKNDAVLRIIMANMVAPGLNARLSLRRRIAILHVVNKRIVAQTHPQLYQAACGSDIRLFCRVAARVLVYQLAVIVRKVSRCLFRGSGR